MVYRFAVNNLCFVCRAVDDHMLASIGVQSNIQHYMFVRHLSFFLMIELLSRFYVFSFQASTSCLLFFEQLSSCFQRIISFSKGAEQLQIINFF